MTFGALGGFLRTPKNPPGYGPAHLGLEAAVTKAARCKDTRYGLGSRLTRQNHRTTLDLFQYSARRKSQFRLNLLLAGHTYCVGQLGNNQAASSCSSFSSVADKLLPDVRRYDRVTGAQASRCNICPIRSHQQRQRKL